MSDKLANAPIFYTAGQVRFNPVLDMAEFVGALQKKWRSMYPDFSVQNLNQLQLQLPGPGQVPEFKMNSTPKWHFKDTEQTSGIVLTTDSIAFQTTSYKTSEQFFKPLIAALQIVHETVSLSYTESVSMRTLDAVIPDDSHDLSFFLNERVLGLSSTLPGNLKHSLLELVLVRPEDQLTARIALLQARIGIPADLAPLTLLLPAKVKDLNGPHAVLDSDCVQTKRNHIDLFKVAESLKVVKRGVTEAFKNSVTTAALELWR